MIWGAVGSSTARFAEFLKGPAQVAAYLRQGGKQRLGHNPLGGWSVAAMLITLATQVGLGLFSVDEDGLEAGPLSRFISFDAGRAVAHVHHLTFWVLVCFIALHLMAVIIHEARGRRLTRAMVTGDTPATFALPTLRLAPARTAIVAAIAAAAFAWFVARGLRI